MPAHAAPRLEARGMSGAREAPIALPAGVVVAGEGQPPAVHALAHAMNQALGNVGKTVLYTDAIATSPVDQTDSLRDLVQDLNAGKVDLLVILVNNFIYGMTGGQNAPTTPLDAKSSTMPFGNFERPFNVPHLAASCGATYVARWTCLHVRQLTKAIGEGLGRKGFRVIEVIAPCPTLYARLNKLGGGLDLMRFYHDDAEIRHGADTREVDIAYQQRIVCGRFVDEERPTYLEMMYAHYRQVLGDKYVPTPPEGGLLRG